MDTRPSKPRFRVASPRRAYAVVIGITALMLAVGLILPLALASSVPSSVDFDRDTPTGDIGIAGQTPTSAPASEEPTDEPSVASGPLTASDQGVTAEAIKVGVVLLDLSSVASVGLGLKNYEIGLQEAAFDAYFELVNDAGGINGRRIEPVYASRDSLAQSGPHSDAAICIKMAKDEQVFALIGYLYATGPCASIQYGIPSVQQQGAHEQEYEESDNYIVSAFPSPERTGRDWARALVETGVIEGHQVGLLSIGDGATENLGALAAEEKLEELGHPVVIHSQLSPTNAIGDVQVAVKNMKDAGVDQVMFSTPFISAIQFMAFAEDQKYYPTYLTSDIGALAGDGLLREAPQSLDGAIGFTASEPVPEGEEESAAAEKCRTEFNDGTDGKDIAAGEESPLTTICGVVDMFVQGALAAGTDLTTQGLVDAFQNLDVTTFPGVLDGSFAPGKTDFTNGLRPERYSNACKCYTPAGDPIYLEPETD